jgi:hypothetical protein
VADTSVNPADPIWGPTFPRFNCAFVLGPSDLKAVMAVALEKAKAHLLNESDRFTLEEEWESLDAWVRKSGCILAGHHHLLAREISREFACTVVGFTIIQNANITSWLSDLYQGGDYLDRHWSCPDVHGVPELPNNRAAYRRTFQGVPGAFAAALKAAPEMVARYLVQIPEFQVRQCQASRVEAEKLKAFPEDSYTLAGGWAWLEMLRRAGYGDLAEACTLRETPDWYLEKALNAGALWKAWTADWQPPLTKPRATLTGEEFFRAERHLDR